MVAASSMLAMPAFGAATAPEATTRYGRVRGFRRNGAAIFLGLPYGGDTSGARRFLPPVAPESWSGVRDATRPGQRSPQPGGDMSQSPLGAYFTGNRAAELTAVPQPMGENCLVLNVVTPSADRGRRPVMVYLHGGGFTTGAGYVMTLGDAFTVREDVVLVTVNHRLGALGYMYLGGVAPEYARGNPGILDLVAALRWVRDNIAHFGGDPDKVTLFGESGGGVKVSTLLAMPAAKGLFRGAVIQSGLYPEPIPVEVASAATHRFMEQMGVSDIAGLRALPFDRFVGAGKPGTMPVADGLTLTGGRWDMAPATAAKVPVIIGYCKDELSLFSIADPTAFRLEWPDVPERLSKSVALPAEQAQGVVAAYRVAFPQDTPSDSYFRISSDASFGRAMVTLADRKAMQPPPVYFYRMEMDTKLPPGLRAIHTAELPMTVGLTPRPEAADLARQISGAWAAFARSGDPNHAGLPAWRPYHPREQETMIFDLVSRSGPDPQAAPRAELLRALDGIRQWNPL
jgi:para-nitrobenzyl esterase